jgi:hypothetical protein
VNPLALVLAASLAAVPAGPHEWSVEMLDGSPAATSTLFSDVVIAPGNSFTSGYLIPHSDDITGPLDISAEPLSAPNDLESLLSFTFGVDGAPGPTVPLTDLLRSGRVAQVASALPAGTPTLDITVSMSAAPTSQAMLQLVRFRFLITVSDQTIVIPVTAPSSLAATGVDPPIRTLVLVAAAIAGGVLALLLSRRRRGRREASPAARPGSPGPPAR